MRNQSAYLPVELNDLAEGLPPAYEFEPVNPLKTAMLPTVVSDLDEDAPSSETGMVTSVNMKLEGKDDGDVQDAPRTADETQQLTVVQPVTESGAKATPVVLIIEDTQELAEVISATLERMGMVTAHETHGQKALAKFESMNPDVVLLDISLPDMTGWKIMDAIKERQDQAVNPSRRPLVIVISAYGDPANRLVGKLQGVHDYLIKPFTADEIERVVTRALDDLSQKSSASQ